MNQYPQHFELHLYKTTLADSVAPTVGACAKRKDKDGNHIAKSLCWQLGLPSIGISFSTPKYAKRLFERGNCESNNCGAGLPACGGTLAAMKKEGFWRANSRANGVLSCWFPKCKYNVLVLFAI